MRQSFIASLITVLVIAHSCVNVHASGEATLIADSMYTFLANSAACTRWLNNTAEIGCSSTSLSLSLLCSFPRIGKPKTGQNPVTGQLVLLANSTMLQSFLQTPAPIHPQIAVLPPKLFTPENLAMLEGRIVGLILLHDTDLPESFSPETTFPQREISIPPNSDFKWNPKGNSLLFHKWAFPVFALNQTDSERVFELAQMNAEAKYGRLWGAELSAFMWASKNSETCLRRGHCVPVGGHSVWAAFPGPVGQFSDVIFSISNIDSSSIFYQRSVGAESDMSGAIANLMALHTLSSVPASEFKKQIVFAFFDAESWGYLGSSRFVRDISGGFSCEEYSEDGTACISPAYPSLQFLNIPFANVSAILEMKQVGKLQSDGSPAFFVHQHQHDFGTPVVSAILSASQGMNFTTDTASPSTPGIPPSSTMAFIKHDQNLQTISAVITDHRAEYINNFYHSVYDDHTNIVNSQICNAATLLARSLYLLATETNPPTSLMADCELTDKLIACLTESWHLCSNITINNQTILPEAQDTSFPTPWHYSQPYNPNLRTFTNKLFYQFARYYAAYSNTEDCSAEQQCSDDSVCVAGRCIKASVAYHPAYSLGVEYKGEWTIVDPNLPIWTEPYWDAPYMKLFLHANTTSEAIIFVWGGIQFFLSLLVIVCCKRYYSTKFKML